VLYGSENKGKGRPEFVADVVEEDRLGPVEFRQGFGPLLFFFERARACNDACHLVGRRMEEPPVPVVEGTVRADARCQKGLRPRLAWPRQRQEDRPINPAAPPAGRQLSESRGNVIYHNLAAFPKSLGE